MQRILLRDPLLTALVILAAVLVPFFAFGDSEVKLGDNYPDRSIGICAQDPSGKCASLQLDSSGGLKIATTISVESMTITALTDTELRATPVGVYLRSMAKGATAAGAPTSTAASADRQLLDVIVRDSSGAAVTPVTNTELRAASVPVAQDILPRTSTSQWGCVLDNQTASARCQVQADTNELYITDVFFSSGTGNQTMRVVTGTGTACATGTVTVVPATFMPPAQSGGFGLVTAHKVAAGHDVCCWSNNTSSYSCRVGGFVAP